ncbi:MAG: DNA alkylation repair protein [Chloroflexi bacterium RBG_16_48_7]|nr:MAG: DNA alkylation repair protein [Chloroflexi bacterium RBG_16_48_7]
MTKEEILKKLRSKARPDQLQGMSRYGMSVRNRLGVAVPDLRAIAKEAKKNHKLALELWDTGIAEARIVASMVDDPSQVTEKQMDMWVLGIDSWDVCDQLCMNLLDKWPLAWRKVTDWSARDEEFVKRTAFSLLACLAWHDKKAEDKKFIDLLPLIKQASTDERNFVKKAVNWALRMIGKRNINLNREAIAAAREIAKLDSKAARWIASDAIKELESPAVQRRLKA